MHLQIAEQFQKNVPECKAFDDVIVCHQKSLIM